MPWNQPGSGGNDQDPWGQRPRGGGQRPPDLDEVLRQAKERFDNVFANRRGGNGGRGSGGGGFGGLGPGALGIIIVIGLGFWAFTGFYTVDEGEQAVELRFGEYTETNGAGLNWHVPYPFESVEIVNTENVNTVRVGYRGDGRSKQEIPAEALMLTQDENIIDIQLAVQYNIKDPRDLLFNVSEYNERNLADIVVRQAAESAVREIVGRNTMDFAITQGRAQLASETKGLVQAILDRYETGINITTVELQDAQPPEQVQDAFADAVRAREDEERLKNLAEAYANDIIPKARGFASRILQEAQAYKAATIARAEGETSRFDQVLEEYSKAPDITRDRLYLETMEEVFSNTSKMVIDQQSGSNNVMYLPLDQLIRNQGRNPSGGNPSRLSSPSAANGASQLSGSLRDGARSGTRTTRQ